VAISLEQFVRQLADSTLLSGDEADALIAALPADKKPQDGEQLARELVRQKKLTAYQAQQIYAGKGRSLLLGNYVILDKLGQGGMGMVLKAVHKRMERVVALKVISPKAVRSPEVLARFHREVKAAARLEHPNIVIAHDADEAAGTHFLVMQYVDGSDLSARVRQHGVLTLDQALDCILQAARGLQYAHEHGVVHRDIKPANLLLDAQGTVKILDMGLARLDSAGVQQDELTGTGQIMGTVDYMAPEQARDTKHADARADIYSLGATLWYLLTGRPLYAGETAVEKLLAHQTKPIPSLRSGCPAATPKLEAAFARMVAKKPEDRYQTMQTLIADLEQGRSGTAVSPTVQTGVEEDSKFDGFLRGMAAASRHRPSAGRKPAPTAAPAVMAKPAPVLVTDPDATEAWSGPQIGTDPKTEQSLPGGRLLAPVAKPVRRPPRPPWWKDRRILAVAAGGLLLVLLGVWIIVRRDASREGAGVPNTVSAGSATAVYGLQLDGKKTYVSVPNWQVPLEQVVTVEAWVTPSQEWEHLSGLQAAVVGWGGTEHSRKLGSSGNSSSWSMVDYTPDRRYRLWSGSRVRPKQRVHLAAVWGSGGERTLFIDGAPASTTQAEGPSDPPSGSVGRLVIGANYYGGEVFPGVLDEVRVSSVARYSKAFVPEPRFRSDEHTLALYHFEEARGDELKDSSGKGHHGKIVGARWVRTEDLATSINWSASSPSISAFLATPSGPAPPSAIAPFDATKAKEHQAAWAKYLGVPVEMENSIGMRFVLIPPGEFDMGSTEEEVAELLEEAKLRGEARLERYIDHLPSEAPKHRVRITKPFWLGRHEVTRAQFRRFVDESGYQTEPERDGIGGYGLVDGQWKQDPRIVWNREPGGEHADDHPVVNLTWNDMTAFGQWLSEKEGETSQLPSEVQWEYACRAGTTTNWYSGDDERALKEHGWLSDNAETKSHPVGQKSPNAWGLYDMHGNVWEGCQDWWGARYYAMSPLDDPMGPLEGSLRVYRGGSRREVTSSVRTSLRGAFEPELRWDDVGFRLARTVSSPP